MLRIAMPPLKPPVLIDPLAGRIANLPIILAGPVLRCVRPRSVTVWIALREPKLVTLEVFELSSLTPVVSSPPRKTVRIGERLHVLAVQAKSDTDVLVPGKIYTYGLKFASVSSATPAHGNLFTKGFLVPGNFQEGQSPDAAGLISYGFLGTPSFALPPTSVSDLKIVHSSCRKPHGPSADALRILDELLAEAPGDPPDAAPARDPKKRPHQLYLSGDQIYADDVASVLLALVMDAAPVLLGAPEKLPHLRPDNSDGFATEFGPATRKELVRRHSLTTKAENHLLAFGEFCAMYLLVLADTLWPAVMPTHDEVFTGQPEKAPSRNVDTWSGANYNAQLAPISTFRRSLIPVRRSLANVPTFMIFDDHDVTDDWFINRHFCSTVLKNENKLGRRIIQNAQMAYAVFQAWGNTPESHDDVTGFIPEPSGKILLDSLEKWGSVDAYAPDTLNFQNAGAIVGMPSPLRRGSDDQVVEGTKQTLFRSDDGLIYSFRQDWPGFEVIVLDSRTQRAYSKGDAASPAHISDESLIAQIPGSIPGDILTLVVCPQPPVMMPIAQYFQEGIENIEKALDRDVETWRFDQVAYEGLMMRLARRGDGRRRVVILSGDVHHAYVWRLQFWGTEAGTGREVALAGANMISSAAKNQESLTLFLHHAGFVGVLPTHTRKATRVSWRLTTSELEGRRRVKKVANTTTGPLEAPFHQNLAVIDNIQRILEAEPGLTFNPAPDTLERRELVRSPIRSAPVDKIEQARPGLQARLDDLLRSMGYHATAYFDTLNPGREVVGKNNLGRLRFSWGPDEAKSVTQELWWYVEDEQALYTEDPNAPKRAKAGSVMTVSLAVEDRPPR